MTAEQALDRYARRRDAEAFRMLVEEYQGVVFAAAGRLLARREDVEDVTQQTFLKLAQGAGRIRKNVGAWLYATAVNGAMDVIRRDATRRRHEAVGGVREVALEEWSELSAVMDEEIAGLPERERGLIVEHFLRGETHRVLAERERVSQATITRRIEGAVGMLRERLGKRGFGGEGVAAGLAVMGSHGVSVPVTLTAELAKVGLAGGGAPVAAGGAGMAVKAAVLAGIIVVGSAAAVWESGVLRSTAVSVVPTSASASVTTTADTVTTWPDLETAATHLAPLYALKLGEEVRKIVPPFPTERTDYVNAVLHPINASIHFSLGFNFSENKLSRSFFGAPNQTLAGILESALRLSWFSVENVDNFQWNPGESDWVVRGTGGHVTLAYDENVGPHLAALAKIISADMGKTVEFASRRVIRPCIVVRGQTHAPTYQNERGIHAIVISLLDDDLIRATRGVAPTPGYTHLLNVSQWLDAPLFSESSNVGDAGCEFSRNKRLNHLQPGFREDLQQILDDIQAQVGGTWTIEDRDIEVWSPVVLTTMTDVDSSQLALLRSKLANAYTLPPFSMGIDYNEVVKSEKLASIDSTLIRSQLFSDQGRFDSTWDVFSLNNDKKIQTYAHRAIWVDGLYLSRQTEVLDRQPVQAFFSHDPSNQRFVTSPECGPYLFGNFQGVSASDMVANAAKITSLHKETVGGAECYVVEGSGSTGKFTFWIDVQSSLVRRAVVVKGSGDLSWGRSLPYKFSGGDGKPDAEESETLTLDNVEIKQINGVWVSISGVQDTTVTYDNGIESMHESAVRSNIVFNPNFSALHAFEMDGVPQNAAVHPLDAGEIVKHHWRDGKLISDVVPTYPGYRGGN